MNKNRIQTAHTYIVHTYCTLFLSYKPYFILSIANTGGIVGLFMGFSFISISEMVYYIILLPATQFLLPEKWKCFLRNKK